MKTLQISESKAKELYSSANPELKAILEDTFGKKFFVESIQDIKTYEECCEIAREKPIDEEALHLAGLLDCEIALRKIKTAIKAANILNNNWVADFSNPNQYKHFNWPMWRSSGFRFCDTYCTDTRTVAGSQLCCGKDEDIKHIGKLFEREYDIFLKGE